MKMDNEISCPIYSHTTNYFCYIYFLGINDTAYALIFAFEMNKVLLTEIQRQEAYKEIQNKINDLVSLRGLDIVVP